MKQCILIVGNPVDGLEFYGPSSDVESAIEFAETNFRNRDWWVAPLVQSI